MACFYCFIYISIRYTQAKVKVRVKVRAWELLPMNLFGNRLKELRGDTSQADLAAGLELKQTTLSNYERGRNEPNFETLQKLCSHFGVNLEWLVFGTGPMYPGPTLEGEQTSCHAELAALKERITMLEQQLAAKDEALAAKQETLEAYKELLRIERANRTLPEKAELPATDASGYAPSAHSTSPAND